MIEFRHDGDLIGWDVGLLWFEKGGVGFAGRTVSFVVPRAIMGPAVESPFHRAVFRSPHLAAKVFETTVGIVPLDRELNAQTTLARIEALPDEVTSETILPPSSMHPDLLQRGLTVRRRIPVLVALYFAAFALVQAPRIHDAWLNPTLRFASSSVSVLMIVLMLWGGVLPRAIRARLPRETRRKESRP